MDGSKTAVSRIHVNSLYICQRNVGGLSVDGLSTTATDRSLVAFFMWIMDGSKTAASCVLKTYFHHFI